MNSFLLIAWLAALGPAAPPRTFVEHTERFKVGPNVTSIVAADLNGDGLPEIVTSDRGRLADPREERPALDQLSYLVAKGDLIYEPQPQLRTGFGPYAIVVANIDALKAPDLVVANFMASRNRDITLLRNIGNHFFEPAHFAVPDEPLDYTKMRDGDAQPIFTTPGITSVIIHDVNRDGYRDAIATGWCSNVLLFFPGTPETYFGAPVMIPAPGGPRDVKGGDFDRDGNIDLVTAMYSSNEIALWKGDGTGDFTEVTRFASRGKLPQKVLLEDMNSDGKLDIIVSHCHADDSIVIFYGEGGFAFGLSQEILLGEERRAIEYEIRDIVTGDFNGDGKPDLAAACYTAKQVVVLINDTGHSQPTQSFRREVYDYEDGSPRALCVGDFNRDSRVDLGVALWHVNKVSLLLGR